MLVEPYNKANCIAMLNTLFPPVTEFTTAATPQLTLRIMKSQRDGFFRYISAIETNGKRILEQMIQHGAQPGDNNGWPLVRDALDKYLRAVNEIIDDCAMANGLGPSSVDEQRKGHNRKADSGVSFGSTQTTGTHNSSDSVLEKPLPPSPAKEPQARSGSTLERLARELRKIGDSGKSKNLKKMKSHSALASRTGSLSNQSLESVFDVDEQKRRRLIWEANNRKKTHSKQPSSDSR